MDRKSVIVIVISLVLILSWSKLVDKVFPPPPRNTNNVALATNQLAGTNHPVTATVSPKPSSASLPLVEANAPEELLSVTNESAIYIFSSHGGGLKSVALRAYQQTIDCDSKKTSSEGKLATLNAQAPLPAMTLLGEGLLGDGVFKLSQTETGIRAEKQLSNGVVVTKDFSIGTNYLLTAKVRLANTTGAPLKLPSQEWVVGTATPMSTNDDGTAIGSYWYNGKSHDLPASWFANKTLGCIPGTPHTEFRSPELATNSIGWAEVHNQFFTIAAIPKELAAQVVSRPVTLTNSREILAGNPHGVTNGYQTGLFYPATELKENGVIEHEFTIYAGPKEYNRIARIGAQYKNKLDDLMGFGGFFGWFAQALLLCLNWFHSLGLNYGLAIIVLTVVVKGLFWPLTAASTKSMKRMQALQPQIKALQDKYKDDPQKFSQKQWELWRENKVNPIGGCMPMLVQMPVFFGLFQMLRSAIELRGAEFLWACDLSRPDTVLTLGGFHVNPIAIIMIGTAFLQAHIMPMPQTMDQQQKIMKYMPVIFLVLFYNVSSGLTLYWTVQNLLTILQTKLTAVKDEPAATAKSPSSPPSKKKK